MIGACRYRKPRSWKKRCTANDSTLRTRNTAPNVFDRGRKCAISRSISSVCRFFWSGYVAGIGLAVHGQLAHMQIDRLFLAERRDDRAGRSETRASIDLRDRLVGDLALLDEKLQVAETGAIVELDEEVLGELGLGLDPAVRGDFGAGLKGQNVADIAAGFDHGSRLLWQDSSQRLRSNEREFTVLPKTSRCSMTRRERAPEGRT